MAEEPLNIQFNASDIDDLKKRLQQRRSFQRQECQPWQQGCEEAALNELLDYWERDYNFQAHAAKLNRLHHYRRTLRAPTPVDEDISIHYVHELSSAPSAIPLLLVHGWPGSIVEFEELIPQLTTNKGGQGFHVVAPSLPGYGYSSAPSKEGLNIELVADMFDNLMQELGYKQYVIQGGDWGGILARAMGVRHPTTCVGLHVNFCVAIAPSPNSLRNAWTMARFLGTFVLLSVVGNKADKAKLKGMRTFFKQETAYQMIQATKPQTLGVALNDSPAGLAAWFLEKFNSWGDTRTTDVFTTFDKDALCTNLTVYWLTRSITSSMRMYYESLGIAQDKQLRLTKDYCSVPTGVSNFPREIIMPTRNIANLTFNIQDWQEHEHGGHFAALEQPKVLEADVRRYYFERTEFTALCMQANKSHDGERGRPWDWVDYTWAVVLIAIIAGCLARWLL